MDLNTENLTSAPEGSSPNLPNTFLLKQNYPNPFNSFTLIEFELFIKTHVTLKIYNINGTLIETLMDDVLSSGIYKCAFYGNQFASGIYFMELNTGVGGIQRKKMLLTK